MSKINEQTRFAYWFGAKIGEINAKIALAE
jgi:hypothetical protein